MTVVDAPAVALTDQAPKLLAHVAGYVGHRTVALGLRSGLIAALAEAAAPLSPDELAETVELDPFYVAVWCRSALAAGICDVDGPDQPIGLDGRYALAPHMATLLLDESHPAYAGGVFTVLEQHEVFDRFEQSLATGARLWWDGCSADWISGVAGTGAPFYTRLVPGGLAQVPGLADRLEAGCRLLDAACGAGTGLVRLATTYPACTVVGADGDRRSLDAAQRRLLAAGVSERCRLVHTPLEELALDEPVSCVVNNISMHECRDIDRVTQNVRAALEPGGWFVISDFPFPDTLDGLRSVPGQVMSGIQFFEAQIDDQLLPRAAYDELLARHGFNDIGSVALNATHALTFGRAPLR